MTASLALSLGTPELLIIMIMGLMVFGGLLLLLTLTLLSVKRAADRSNAAARDQERPGEADH